ncbi:hypothetical protein F2Q70_00002240 [Brassica cretica]|uniref:Uncharacterized protein n=1 Tax=Brassica cretica TaxID=69181 RepID=A0A8S9IWC9_BRACR|nr:hypothetical protein F2Q70_00002240 [Brassica cretica]
MELDCLSVSSTLLRFEYDELSCRWNKNWKGEAESFHVGNRSDPNIVANNGKTNWWIRQLLRQLMWELWSGWFHACERRSSKRSRLSQDALSKDKTLKTESTLLEVSVITLWPFETSEHMRCSCWSKGDATWLVHEWACDQMDQLGLSVRNAIDSREGPGLAYSDESKWDLVRMDYDLVVSA